MSLAAPKRTADPHGQKLAWEDLKATERQAKAQTSILDDVPLALPALLRAEKLQRRASSVGFDWDNADKVVEKIAEEAREVVEPAWTRTSARRKSATCFSWSPTSPATSRWIRKPRCAPPTPNSPAAFNSSRRRLSAEGRDAGRRQPG